MYFVPWHRAPQAGTAPGTQIADFVLLEVLGHVGEAEHRVPSGPKGDDCIPFRDLLPERGDFGGSKRVNIRCLIFDTNP